MRKLVVLLFLFTSLVCVAQDDDDDDDYLKDMPTIDDNGQKYLKDGVHSDAGNFVSLSISELIGGFAIFHYERKITNMISGQASIGLPIWRGVDYVENITEGINADHFFNYLEDGDMPGGYAYSVSVRRNPFRRAITQYGYRSLNFRNRVWSVEQGTLSRQDYYFATGWKKLYNSNLGLELNQGIGMRRTKFNYKGSYELKPSDPEESSADLGFFYMIDFKIGYFF